MGKNDEDKKIGGVGSATSTTRVRKTTAVDAAEQISQVDKTGSISSARRRATNLMTSAEREQLLAMIDDEANELTKKGMLPAGKADVIAQAVKMAVDSGIVVKDGDGKK